MTDITKTTDPGTNIKSTVFLSYSSKDHFFAELAEIKLKQAEIILWRDKDKLVAGKDWQEGIETGISNSIAILVALSDNSAESSYVTYEWAYAIGKGKPIIPIKLSECQVHPKLSNIQYLDFSVNTDLPWASLIQRINEIETDNSPIILQTASPIPDPDDVYVQSILSYLNQRGYQMASFDRLRKRINENITDDHFMNIISKNSSVFRIADLKDGKKGLAKLIP